MLRLMVGLSVIAGIFVFSPIRPGHADRDASAAASAAIQVSSRAAHELMAGAARGVGPALVDAALRRSITVDGTSAAAQPAHDVATRPPAHAGGGRSDRPRP